MYPQITSNSTAHFDYSSNLKGLPIPSELLLILVLPSFDNFVRKQMHIPILHIARVKNITNVRIQIETPSQSQTGGRWMEQSSVKMYSAASKDT